MKWLCKGLIPIMGIGALLFIFKSVYYVDHEVDLFRLWCIAGIPFGMTRCCIWLIPRGYDVGGTVGMLALCIVLAGIAGGLIAIATIIQAGFYLVMEPMKRLVKRRI